MNRQRRNRLQDSAWKNHNKKITLTSKRSANAADIEFVSTGCKKEETTELTLIHQPGTYVLSESCNGKSTFIFEPHFLSDTESQLLLDTLLTLINFESHKNAEGKLLREYAWFGKMSYSYASNVCHTPNEVWPNSIIELKMKIEEFMKAKHGIDLNFNSLLVNKYQSGRQSIGWHADNEYCLGQNPIIASISIGDSRMFELKPQFGHTHGSVPAADDKATVKIPLCHGSLLVMTGAMQQDWLHRVPREYHDRGMRINLTFRKTHEMKL